jgi:hypothetical protein
MSENAVAKDKTDSELDDILQKIDTKNNRLSPIQSPRSPIRSPFKLFSVDDQSPRLSHIHSPIRLPSFDDNSSLITFNHQSLPKWPKGQERSFTNGHNGKVSQKFFKPANDSACSSPLPLESSSVQIMNKNMIPSRSRKSNPSSLPVFRRRRQSDSQRIASDRLSLGLYENSIDRLDSTSTSIDGKRRGSGQPSSYYKHNESTSSIGSLESKGSWSNNWFKREFSLRRPPVKASNQAKSQSSCRASSAQPTPLVSRQPSFSFMSKMLSQSVKSSSSSSSFKSLIKKDNSSCIDIDNLSLMTETSSKVLPLKRSSWDHSSSPLRPLSSTDSFSSKNNRSVMLAEDYVPNLTMGTISSSQPREEKREKKKEKFHRRRSYSSNSNIFDAYSNKLERFDPDDICSTTTATDTDFIQEGYVDDLVSEPDTINPAFDSWESVTEQPYCPVCDLVFKSSSLLKKHVDFSSVHASNIKKIEDLEKNEFTLQEEGVDYKLMYSGSKFYWRSKLNVEIELYLHLRPLCFEVVPFEPNVHKEMKRLYIDSTIISSFFESEVAAAVEGIRKRILEDRFKNSVDVATMKALHEQEWRRVVISYLIGALRVETVEECHELILSADKQDMKGALEAVFVKKPSSVVPVHISRRRITHEEESYKASQLSLYQVAITAISDKNKVADAIDALEGTRSNTTTNSPRLPASPE